MSIDEKTPELNLPLPHPENTLEEDVVRLRAAFGGLDTYAKERKEKDAAQDAALQDFAESQAQVLENIQDSAEISKAWAESDTSPDDDNSESKSSKTWANEARKYVENAEEMLDVEAVIGKTFEFIDNGKGKPTVSNSVRSVMGCPIAGTVVAFSGQFNGVHPIPLGLTTADTTWHICNGENGTPNLRNKFILGGDGSSQGDTGGDVVTEGHTLTVDELARHGHTATVYSNSTASGGAFPKAINNGAGARSWSVTASGGSQSHSHNQNLPPYYTLAYIMKIS